MERCERREFQITQFADGTLPESERAGLEEHLEDCPECRAALDETREALGLLGESEWPEPSAEFSAGIADKVYDAYRESMDESPARVYRPSAWRGGWKAVAAMAAALLLAVGFMAQQNVDSPGAARTAKESTTLETPTIDEVLLAAFTSGDASSASAFAEVDENLDVGFNSVDALYADLEETEYDVEDYEWAGERVSGTTGSAGDDLFSLIEDMTEEEAAEILEGLEDVKMQTSLPYGVS